MSKIDIMSDGTAAFVSADEEKIFLETVKAQSAAIAEELLSVSALSAGKILVVGCSSSEVTGNRIGKASIPSVADAILDGMLPELEKNGVFLAAQCCEHLNRAIIIERELADRLGLDEETTDILGINVPSIVLPVCPGRNLSVVIEVAAMNNRQKRMGYNTAQEFNKRLMESMGGGI